MGSVVLFPRRYERGIDEVLEAHMRRERTRICADCETLREESERIKRDYEERQQRIEVLMAGIHADVERA